MNTDSAMPIRVKGIALMRLKMPGHSSAATTATMLTAATASMRCAMCGRIEPRTVKTMSRNVGCLRTIIGDAGARLLALPARHFAEPQAMMLPRPAVADLAARHRAHGTRDPDRRVDVHDDAADQHEAAERVQQR